MNNKRIAVAAASLMLTLGLGSGLANAAPIAAPHPPAVVEIAHTPNVTDGVVGPAAATDARTAMPTATGTVMVKAIKECGLGALVGDTTGELSLANVVVFVNAAGKRLAAVAGGPLAIITVVAQGCIERVIGAFGGGSGSLGSGSLGSGSLGSGSLGSGSLGGGFTGSLAS